MNGRISIRRGPIEVIRDPEETGSARIVEVRCTFKVENIGAGIAQVDRLTASLMLGEGTRCSCLPDEEDDCVFLPFGIKPGDTKSHTVRFLRNVESTTQNFSMIIRCRWTSGGVSHTIVEPACLGQGWRPEGA